MRIISITGNDLVVDDLTDIAAKQCTLVLAPSAVQAVQNARAVVDTIVAEKRVVYGISTGFGVFADKTVGAEQLSELQFNLIRSHCCGVGEPMALEQVRVLLALRINVLAKGFSGIRLETLQQMVDAFNADCLSYVPQEGTVGASGDLAPLAHLALGLIGEGKMWNGSAWADSAQVLAARGLKPIMLQAKEGLASINGCQFICTYGCKALSGAKMLALQADVVAAMTLEAVYGCRDFLNAAVHESRPHAGQIESAARMRALLGAPHESQIYSSLAAMASRTKKVQDCYSLRCTPQVHGTVHDVLRTASRMLSTEINSATDNPLVISGTGEILSAGNFHGAPVAKASDLISIAATDIANISLARLERLLNPAIEKNSGLPAFLIPQGKGGVNSGCMIMQYTAAALTAQNRSRCNNPSTQTIATCNGQEDTVSMGGFAALNADKIAKNSAIVLAIELIAACQALEFRRPLTTTPVLEAVYALVRTVVPPMTDDRTWSDLIEAVAQMLLSGRIWQAVEPLIGGVASTKADEKQEESDNKEGNDDEKDDDNEKDKSKAKSSDVRVPKGFRDFAPEQMAVRAQVIDTITDVYERHGAVSIQTPVCELKSVLVGNYGENEKLIFELADQGSGTALALRYDLTVGLARYVGMNGITKLKRYQIGEVYRRDQPVMTKGRYRAFYQCDFDICGDYGGSMLPDAECLLMLDEVLRECAIGKYLIKVNHRALLEGMYQQAVAACTSTNEQQSVPSFDRVCASLDKLDKEPWPQVAAELVQRGMPEAGVDVLRQMATLRNDPRTLLAEIRSRFPDNRGIKDMAQIFEYLDAFGVDWSNFSFDLSLARGLSYYTGLVVEAVFLGPDPARPETMIDMADFAVGSIAGGGRYDNLIGRFGSTQVPAVGFSMGIERLFTIKEQQYAYQKKAVKCTATQVLVCAIGAEPAVMCERLRLCNELWKAGVAAETMYAEKLNMKKQIEHALDNQIPLMLVLGESEIEKGMVQVKVLADNKRYEVRRDQVVAHVIELNV